MNTKILKLIASIPVILLTLYFIPFLGICLIVFRLYLNKNEENKYSFYMLLVILGILINIPKFMWIILVKMKYNISKIPYLSIIIKSDLYNINFIKYSKLLISIGIIFIIITFIINNIISKIHYKINSKKNEYIRKYEQQQLEISKQNDMIIKEKQQKAKTTNYVRCPYCGSDNIISEKIGTCKYCRRKIENPYYKQD